MNRLEEVRNMCRTRVKMCGTTRLEDAMAAVRLGVDALGFIFVKKSPRCISPVTARAIIDKLPPFVSRVGVFVNHSLDEIRDIYQQCGLTQVQLHGDESVQFCQAIKNWNLSCSISKAFRVGDGAPPSDFASYEPVVDSVLIDTYINNLDGGTGRTFDWHILDTRTIDRPLILAGGLTPENVAGAIKTIRPFAIDINSGVELSPGVKDHEKIWQLLRQAKAADAQLSGGKTSLT